MKINESEEFFKLRTWAETIIKFLNGSKDESDLINDTEDLMEIYELCVVKGHLSTMKMFIHELNEIARARTEYTDELLELNRILMEKFGEDLFSTMSRKMDGVLKRGKIQNDEEFVRVNEWIDHLLYDKDNPDAQHQIEQYNQLLLEYQERVARRLRKSNPS